jgi:RNA polymerase sigma factor (sigma-70 family)
LKKLEKGVLISVYNHEGVIGLENTAVTSAIREQLLEKWITQYGNAILRTCFVYLSDTAQAEDAMQDTFLKAWNSMNQFERRNEDSEKAWLMRIAINICHDYHRSKWFRHVDRSKVLEALPVHLDSILPQDRSLLLDILQLPEKYKQVILLYYYQEMTLQEVSDVLRISHSTVHLRMQKAQKLLAQALVGRDL